MWSSFLDKGKELAEKAKRAAEALDKQLDETVGIQSSSSGATTTTSILPSFASSTIVPPVVEDDDALQWNDDDEGRKNEEEYVTLLHSSASAAVIKEEEDGWGAEEDVENLEFDTESILRSEPAAIVQQQLEPLPDDSQEISIEQQQSSHPEKKEAESIAETAEQQSKHLETALEESSSSEQPAQNVPEISIPTEQEIKPSLETAEQEHSSEEHDPAGMTTEPSVGGGFWGIASLGSALSLGQPPVQPPQQQPSSSQPTSQQDEAMMMMTNDDETMKTTSSMTIGTPSCEKMPQKAELPATEAAAETLETAITTSSHEDVPTLVQETSAPQVETTEMIPTKPSLDHSVLIDEPNSSNIAAADATIPFETKHPDICDDQQQQQKQQVLQTEETHFWEQKVLELQNQLAQREEQLFSKTEQMTMMESMFETEKQDLLQKIQSTKEEAKRRIQKAKERVEAMEQRLQDVTASQTAGAEDAQKQAAIIAALREEGEKLARRQMDMEAAVRAAKGETRELREQLEELEASNLKAEEKIAKLEAELKTTKEDLASARRGESQADKLDAELRSVREESEKRAATILSLELEVKELKASQKELRKELEATQKGAAVETMQEIKKLQKEHGELVSDLEAKIRSTEREAAVREDSLRHEVDELRKRWQDAVRRADALSVDVQSSTAPLLRQLESTNKQHRARATAWAELETQLRAELEENVIQNEKLSKERSEWKTKCIRLERMNTEFESELKQLKSELLTKTSRVETLEQKIAEMEEEGAKMKEEWAEVERLANEGVSRVRSEMSKTVVEAEERHRMQLDSLETQLKLEREQRSQLEKQVENLLEKVGMFVPETVTAAPVQAVFNETKPKTLRQSESQIEILSGALGGFGADEEVSDDEDEDMNGAPASGGGASSFAALEQLTSRLKAAKVELATLKDRLSESERTREELVQDLAEARNAREKLPLFEAKVQELSAENEELRQEVEGLREDIMDVKTMYRTQLNVLLEEKAALNGKSNESSPKSAEDDDVPANDNEETLKQSD